MDDYFSQKKKLFYQMKNNFSPIIINIDDNYGLKLYEEFKSQSLTYGLSKKASYRATEIKIKKNKTKFLLVDPQNKKTSFIIPFIGIHNVYNALASIVALHKSGLKLNEIKKKFLKVKDIPGRLQLISKKNKKFIYIDYAHTEKALIMVLQSLNLIRKNKLWLVFGCGGNRDKNKRQKMGQVAKFYADQIIITSDNPRNENELDICNEIMIGCTNHDNVEIILDRKIAIKTAINKSQKNDIILVAGKGHENYQEINGKMITFNDTEVVHEVLNDK
jgi:UDP-N-acetylmuramoyl-L-alanyl-D-glutamate--2,6-diaminopimelate ligase